MDILEFKDYKFTPDIVYKYNQSEHTSSTAIIIDNGAYQCRAGWAIDNIPRLVFRNIVAKPRKERLKKDGIDTNITVPPIIQVGNDIINLEPVRFQLKSQFDKNVVTHYEVQEQIFDYIFMHLGINTNNCVEHPIVMTEAFLNPNCLRQAMSELLFECYSVPKVAYGVDFLFSHYFNSSRQNKDNALIVSLGYNTCHVIPIVNGQLVFENCRRLNVGGLQITTFLHRILQLKYPAHCASITLSRAEELLHSICLIAENYKEEMKRWTDADYYDKHTKVIQLPYNANTATITSTLTAEQQRDRKRELAKRLIETNARKRESRLAEYEEKLEQLLQIQALYDQGADDDEMLDALSMHDMKDVQELQRSISVLEAKVQRIRDKMEEAAAAASSSLHENDEPPPKQHKINNIVFETETEMNSYIEKVKQQKQDILSKKYSRKQRKLDMTKRRTAACQERMRIISHLAKKEKGNDDFGERDEDWDIYKTISKYGRDSDSEADTEKLTELDDILRLHDPDHSTANAYSAQEMHQLHVGVERYRAPELLFKPYMIGSTEAGLSELISFVISKHDATAQFALAANVVLVGALTVLPGLRDRILYDLIVERPYGSRVNVEIYPEPILGAWHGARSCANLHDDSVFITRQKYDECGSEYLQEHYASNPFYVTPKEEIPFPFAEDL